MCNMDYVNLDQKCWLLFFNILKVGFTIKPESSFFIVHMEKINLEIQKNLEIFSLFEGLHI